MGVLEKRLYPTISAEWEEAGIDAVFFNRGQPSANRMSTPHISQTPGQNESCVQQRSSLTSGCV